MPKLRSYDPDDSVKARGPGISLFGVASTATVQKRYGTTGSTLGSRSETMSVPLAEPKQSEPPAYSRAMRTEVDGDLVPLQQTVVAQQTEGFAGTSAQGIAADDDLPLREGRLNK
eukprot:593573-Amphidinium_carterae.1